MSVWVLVFHVLGCLRALLSHSFMNPFHSNGGDGDPDDGVDDGN